MIIIFCKESLSLCFCSAIASSSCISYIKILCVWMHACMYVHIKTLWKLSGRSNIRMIIDLRCVYIYMFIPSCDCFYLSLCRMIILLWRCLSTAYICRFNPAYMLFVCRLKLFISQNLSFLCVFAVYLYNQVQSLVSSW